MASASGPGRTAAVVADHDVEAISVVADADLRVRCAGVLADVGQALLHDPIGGKVERWWKRSSGAVELELDREPRPLGVVDEPLDVGYPGLRFERRVRVCLALA